MEGISVRLRLTRRADNELKRRERLKKGLTSNPRQIIPGDRGILEKENNSIDTVIGKHIWGNFIRAAPSFRYPEGLL